MSTASRLVLGGHSFIEQLGNDPALAADGQLALVQACLDQGISTFDTTYQPERVALGRALATLGRRAEAQIIAWNFFTPFGLGDDVGGPRAYRPADLETMQRELQTDHIDMLVVHEVGDREADEAQLDLALQWQQQGLVEKLGLWNPTLEQAQELHAYNPYQFMVQPYNVDSNHVHRTFRPAAFAGLKNYACSPFVRGHRLVELAEALADYSGQEIAQVTAEVADLMLRYTLFRPNVHYLIVSMRRVEWVAANLASEARGPLDEYESLLLQGLLHD